MGGASNQTRTYTRVTPTNVYQYDPCWPTVVIGTSNVNLLFRVDYVLNIIPGSSYWFILSRDEGCVSTYRYCSQQIDSILVPGMGVGFV